MIGEHVTPPACQDAEAIVGRYLNGLNAGAGEAAA